MGVKRGVSSRRVLKALFLKGFAGAKTVVIKALELTFWIVKGVRVAFISNDDNIMTFVLWMELGLV